MSRILAISVIVLLPAVGQAQGLPQRVADLEARLAALESGTQPTHVDVDCGVGGSVQAVLNQYRWKPGALSVGVSGVCWEHIILSRDDVAILALSSGAGFATTSTSASLVIIRGAQRAQLFGLTLQGGVSALHLAGNASVLAVGVQLSGATNGLHISDAQLDMSDSVIENNSTFGVAANSGARLTLATSTVRGNGFTGIYATDASVRIRQTVVEANSGGGVGGEVGARLDITGGTIRDNGQAGVGAQTATIRIQGNTVISGNAGGIGLYHGSSVHLRGVIIENNTASGIGVTGGSTVLFGGAATNIIRNNTGPGIRLNDTSTAGRFTDATLQITGNPIGIRCQASPGVAQIVGGPGGYAITLAHVFGNGGVKQIDCPGF